jgi:hypothetical protein
MKRRDFLTVAGSASLAPLVALPPSSAEAPQNIVLPSSASAAAAQNTSTGQKDRATWIALMQRLADPVLKNLANGTLKARMPIEQAPTATNRPSVTHLEAIGRLMAGLAPWIALPPDETAEGSLRAQYLDLARRAIAKAVDPASPDFLNFAKERQPLVDAAFLAQGVLRARKALGDDLDPSTRRQLVAALESTRVISPGFNNWLLFSATVETALAVLGASWDRMRVDYALRQHEQWYKGDGVYGDGPEFHWDYYNSFVIQPMLLDVLDVCKEEMPAWKSMVTRVDARARRYAAILERLVAPDGTYPAIGRSITYRCGAFHLLAQMALRKALPDEVTPAQTRGALTAVMHRTLEAPETFDRDGWLRIGLCGHQPGVGETYISTGSLYLCAMAFLPLGLPASDAFWSSPAQPWTSVRAWSGQSFPIDHALTS